MEEIIAASAPDLMQWLEDQVARTPGPLTDEGTYISIGQQRSEKQLSLDARWVDSAGIFQERPKVIRFEFRRLAEHHTQVIGTCSIRLLDPYFGRMWAELLRVFVPYQATAALDEPIPPTEDAQPPLSPGGRGSHNEDIQAWRQIHENRQPPEKVRPEWEKRASSNPSRKETLKASLDRKWRDITNPNWKAAKKRTKPK